MRMPSCLLRILDRRKATMEATTTTLLLLSAPTPSAKTLKPLLKGLRTNPDDSPCSPRVPSQLLLASYLEQVPSIPRTTRVSLR